MVDAQATTLITGAASGLGWELAQRYARLGHRLLLVDCNAEALEECLTHLQTQLQTQQPQANHCSKVQDLTGLDAAEQIVAWVATLTPSLTLLINNAGITHRSVAQKTQPAVFRRVMAVDYFAPLELTLALRPLLETAPDHRDRGVIVIGSMAGWMPVLGRAGYCAAKAALHQFFETARAEGLIRADELTLIYPSFLATPIEQNALDQNGHRAQHRRSSVGKIRDAGWMAERIITNHRKRKRRCFPDRFSAMAAWLYRLWPDLYLRLMRQRLAEELTSDQSVRPGSPPHPNTHHH
ncbi:SDR family NAD(P)-dependent oxidoreductase [Saccharospirillum sp. HFRX-1]|uniref:SDR family NAD(P)-dependent oxidoreductase n=1 Tax=unclassified Saccharospirillum TaxID=2633430 RepID=UPI00371BF2A3